MKGISNWIWIAGGIMAGLIIISIAYMQISQVNLNVIEQRSLEQYGQTKNIIDGLCWSFVGNRREYEISLGETVEGIYIAPSPYEEYERDQLINKVVNEESGTGNFLCIKIRNKRVECQGLECNATMPFIGSVPEEFSLSALVSKLTGKGLVFNYRLTFVRTESNVAVEFTPSQSMS